jgi:hypothetical protein
MAHRWKGQRAPFFVRTPLLDAQAHYASEKEAQWKRRETVQSGRMSE